MRLPIFQPRKLQFRIVAVYLGLLVVVQAATFWFIQDSIDRNARIDIQNELSAGERVMQQLFKQNSDRLDQATRVLAADYGFRSAIASGDQETMQSALVNNSERIHANVALFADAALHLKAATSDSAEHFLGAVQRYAMRTMSEGELGYQFEVIDGLPYQIVAVPVRAPAVIGWVGMAFPVDEALLQNLKSMTELDVALMLPQPGMAHWQTMVATLPKSQWATLGHAWHPDDPAPVPNQGTAIQLGGTELSAHALPLPGSGGTAMITAVLMRSVDAALAPYRQLRLNLLLLSTLGVAVCGVGSVFVARHITTPLRSLSSSARQLEKGDYDTAVQVKDTGRDEIGDLALSFETMRRAIQEREVEIRRLAYEDGLTALPNREQFRNDLREAIEHTQRAKAPCTVLMLDLDRFKHVNDVLGHRFGDRLLRAVADRLKNEVLQGQSQALLARLGGDEFAVLLPAADAASAHAVAARILRAFEHPITLDDHTVDLGAGIGLASSPEHGLDADVLLGRAEVAMYAAKQKQAGTVTYHPNMDSSSEESLSLLSELRYAVDHGQMRLFLQPKVNLRTNAVVGAEALVRWQHPTRGMVPPMRFIPFAEQTGFVRVLTMWMLDQVAQMSQSLTARGLRMKLAVNLSTRDLMDQELPAKIEQLLSHYTVDPKLLVLEITESAIMDDPQRALQTLNRLHGMGLKLSIDDFGTGYSSLAYLKRLPVNELKIDKSFVMNMETDMQDAKIVYSTIELAHNLGLSVVAEGIESAKVMSLLAGLACDEAQGYFIAKPMPGDQFAAWAEAWEPRLPEPSPHEFMSVI